MNNKLYSTYKILAMILAIALITTSFCFGYYLGYYRGVRHTRESYNRIKIEEWKDQIKAGN